MTSRRYAPTLFDALLVALLSTLLFGGCASQPVPPGGYRVLGKVYYRLDTADGYSEVGKASWYGKKFHGKVTANGEIYDMYARTAAHKTLPLGTTVKVTRLDDGRSVTARINDRGPFVEGRIIDLSYTLANELGMADEGTTRVRVETVSGPAAQISSTSSTSGTNSTGDAGGVYSWQVGSFASRDNAERTAQTARDRFDTVQVVEAQVKGSTYYRVRVGEFTSKKAAEAAYPKLTHMGFDPMLVSAR